MRVVIDWDLCESNGVCEGFAPEVFRVNDDDELEVLIERPGTELRAEVEQAATGCPRGAIKIVEG